MLQTNFLPHLFLSNKVLVQKKCWSKKKFGGKNVRPKKNVGPKKNLVQKKFWSETLSKHHSFSKLNTSKLSLVHLFSHFGCCRGWVSAPIAVRIVFRKSDKLTFLSNTQLPCQIQKYFWVGSYYEHYNDTEQIFFLLMLYEMDQNNNK